ncbi:MAG: hypothetical protein ACL93V_14290 [Candidatus Electrothrix sp. YB6]
MKTNQHLADAVYKQVGEEMIRKEFSPGAMARAVAEANGNKALAESLYAKFRFEELMRELEREVVAESSRRKKEEERQAEAIRQERQKGIYMCPNCGYYGKPKQMHQGSVLLMFLLLSVYVIPGIIYALIFNGHKGVCPKCGTVVAKKM